MNDSRRSDCDEVNVTKPSSHLTHGQKINNVLPKMLNWSFNARLYHNRLKLLVSVEILPKDAELVQYSSFDKLQTEVVFSSDFVLSQANYTLLGSQWECLGWRTVPLRCSVSFISCFCFDHEHEQFVFCSFLLLITLFSLKHFN